MEDSAIDGRYGFSQGQAHPHFFFPFLFSVILLGFGFAALSLHAVLLGFSTHPLHSPSRIDKGELPSVAAMRLRLAGRGLWRPGGDLLGASELGPSAAGQLQRRDTGNHLDSIDRLNIGRLGAVH